MFKKNALLRALIAAGLTTGLAACGGGSSGGSDDGSQPPGHLTPPTETELTGQFIDSAVGGLEYTAEPSGISGITTDQGGFRYQQGDTIRFTVGKFEVGSAEGAEMISPLSISPTNEDGVANIARFLQTLDDDGIVENGITINNAAKELASNSASGGNIVQLDLESSEIQQGILDLTSNNSVKRGALVNRDSAMGHLTQTLDNFKTASIESCSADADSVEPGDLTGKTFGRIAGEEITLFIFGSGNSVTEIASDQGSPKQDSGTWSLDGQAQTLKFEWTGYQDTISVCRTNNSIIMESGDTHNKFFEVVQSDLQAGDAFLLSYVSQHGDEGALLQLTSESEYELVTGSGPEKTGNWTSGNALTLNDDGNIYFLKGQNNRIGIHVKPVDGEPAIAGTATAVPLISEPKNETFIGQSFLLRNNEENSVYMLDFVSGTNFVRYTNESDTGQQTALFSEGTWQFQNQRELTLTVNGYDEIFVIWDAGNVLLVADKGSEIMAPLHKIQQIKKAQFAGEYNVNIPTENVVNNALVINNDQTCSYEGTACSWDVESNGRTVISFPGKPEKGHIWQVAGSASDFGFVMIHEDKFDIEPGFMTRK